MKKMQKVFALLIAMAMVLGMCTVAFAAPVEGNTYTYEGTDATTNGKIEITNATKDETYLLYKIFDATYASDDSTKISYTIKEGALKNELEANGTDYFTIGATPDANGNYSVTRTGTTSAEGTFTPAKSDAELIAYLSTDTMKALYSRIGDGIKSSVDGSISFEKIPYGYYFVTSTLGTVVTIDSNNPTASIIDKNQTSSFEKKIVKKTSSEGGAETEALTSITDAKLNEDVPYRVTVKATNYDGDKKIFKYVVSDTIDNGMTYKAAPAIKVGDVTPAAASYTITYKDKDGTAVTDISKAQSFEIEINWTTDGTKNGTHLYDSNVDLVVEYTAFLDPEKADDIVVGGTTDANTNLADVKYYKGDDTTPSGDLPDQKTDTFVTDLTISKKDDDGKALQGAEFTLTGPRGSVVITTVESFVTADDGTYYLLKDGTYTTEAPTGDTEHDAAYESTTDKYSKTTTTTTSGAGQSQTDIKAAVGSDGKVTFTGLAAGDYKLVESVVPAGYNKIADITFTVTFDYEEIKDTEGKVTGYKGAFGTKDVLPAGNTITVGADNKLAMNIVNRKGTELPSTGGIGTTIFYLVGAMLVIGAGVVLVTRRRMDAH